MSLNGALQIGRSALVASQAGIQLAGNNMANAGTVGFHRQSLHLVPAGSEILGRNATVGTGVQIQAIRREIDQALQSRYRDSVSSQSGTQIDQRFLSTIESLQSELGDNDISSLLSTFFNSFSELANNPEDNAVRSVVIQQGVSVASRLSSLREDYGTVLREIDRSLGNSIQQADDLLDRIAEVNRQITLIEGPGGDANALRDQRDVLIDELAQYVEVSTVEQSNGSVDVFVGSIPVVLGGQSRGLELRTQADGDQTEITVRVAADGTTLQMNEGSIGGLLRQREETVRPQIESLDTFAGQLIFQVNRLHSQGQGREGFSSVTGSRGAGVNDLVANLNSTAADLPFNISNGSFFIHVTHAGTGLRTTHQIAVDGNAMSMNNLLAEINTTVGVPNVTASLGPGNELVLTSAAGYTMSFSDDTSGALAALGVNTFFTGENAADINVNSVIENDPTMLAAGRGHIAGSNDTAVAIADIQNTKFAELGGKSLREHWQNTVGTLAVKTQAANASAQATAVVKDSLAAQIQAVSGVSLDEESINLMTFQRQFQAAARFISVIDETLQVLLSIV